MILEKEKRTFFYNCLAITGWFCIIALLKYISFFVYHLCFKRKSLDEAISLMIILKVFLFQVAVVASVGLAIAILLMVIESCFPLKFPSYKFLDTKIMEMIYSIGFLAECIFFMPVVIAVLGAVIYSLI